MRRFGLLGVHVRYYLFSFEEEGRKKEDDDEGKWEEGIKGKNVCDEIIFMGSLKKKKERKSEAVWNHSCSWSEGSGEGNDLEWGHKMHLLVTEMKQPKKELMKNSVEMRLKELSCLSVEV